MIALFVGIFSVLLLAFIASLFKITKLNSFKGFISGFLQLFSVGMPVAIVEEYIFRLFPMAVAGKGIFIALITSLIFALVHFTHGMYAKKTDKKEKVMLFIGLTILGMGLFQLHIYHPYWNILYHAGIITGVSITANVFAKEEKEYTYFWDESHAIIRTPLAWLIMTLGFYLLIKITYLQNYIINI